MADINWAEIKLCYITSEQNLSYQHLADKFGVSKSAVAGKCSKENWEEERESYRSKMITKIQDTIITEKARRHRRAVAILDMAINSGGQNLLKDIASGKTSITVPQLLGLLDLERRMMINEKMKDFPKKVINKRIQDLTAEELEKVINGDAMCITDAEIEEDNG